MNSSHPSTPPVSATPSPDPTPPTPSPRRAPTFLGRLEDAVRRQDGVAIAVELVIVVLGVLIAFQVNAWGQARSDRAQEQTYLRQLAADLAETERIVADRDARMAPVYAGIDHLLRSFDTPQRPPPDSVVAWLREALYLAAPRPVLGTAEALVTSGDLGLIADDALRAAILRYLDVNREALQDQAAAKEIALELYRTLFIEYVDYRTVVSRPLGADTVIATILGAVPALTPTAPSWRPPFPLDVDVLYRDPGFYRTLGQYAVFVGEVGRARGVMGASAAELRARVEARIER